MPHWENLNDFQKKLFKKDTKLIGWGSGSVFLQYYSSMPVDLSYVVDSNDAKWGSTIHGFEIKSPEALLTEDPDNTLIIVYSSFIDQITEQTRTYGEFPVIPASLLFFKNKENIILPQKLKNGIERRSPLRKQPDDHHGIVIQGPFNNDDHVNTVKYYSHAYPQARIVLSTWEASNPLSLKKIEPFVDEVVLNTPPDFAGYQNRNYQIVSTHSGIQKLKQYGVKKILKARTDVPLLAEQLLTSLDNLTSQYNANTAKAFGLQGRILIPEIYTRKYLLYHPSDIIMYGHTSDIDTYWNIPLDDRHFHLLKPEWQTRSIKDIAVHMGPPEAYLGRHFAQSIKRDLKDTLTDSWEFYRDFFIILDNDWLEPFWYKYPVLPSLETENPTHNCLSYYTWQRLYHGNFDWAWETQQIDINTVTWDAFRATATTPA